MFIMTASVRPNLRKNFTSQKFLLHFAYIFGTDWNFLTQICNSDQVSCNAF